MTKVEVLFFGMTLVLIAMMTCAEGKSVYNCTAKLQMPTTTGHQAAKMASGGALKIVSPFSGTNLKPISDSGESDYENSATTVWGVTILEVEGQTDIQVFWTIYAPTLAEAQAVSVVVTAIPNDSFSVVVTLEDLSMNTDCLQTDIVIQIPMNFQIRSLSLTSASALLWAPSAKIEKFSIFVKGIAYPLFGDGLVIYVNSVDTLLVDYITTTQPSSAFAIVSPEYLYNRGPISNYTIGQSASTSVRNLVIRSDPSSNIEEIS